jgi:hypothetical protein
MCLCLFTSGLAISQNLYVKIGGGYNFGLPAQLMLDNYISNYYDATSPSYSTESEQGIYGSLGQGLGLDAAIGYTGDMFGVEIGIQYKPESSIEGKGINNTYYSTSTYLDTDTRRIKSSLLSISPCLVVKTDMGLYGRVGVVLGFPKFTTEQKLEEAGTYSGTYETSVEYTGSMALGYTGAVGITIGSGNIKLYVEANFVSLSWAPDKSETIMYKANGVDQLSTLSTSDRITLFQESYSVDSRNIDPNKESVSLKSYAPYSFLGLKAGITLEF